MTSDLKETIESWRFNVELECNGISLSAIEKIAIGGAVLELNSLLPVLEFAAHAETQLAEARAVIEPFSEACTISNCDDDETIEDRIAAEKITFGHLRRARAFLTPNAPSCPRCGHTTDSEIHAFGCKELTS